MFDIPTIEWVTVHLDNNNMSTSIRHLLGMHRDASARTEISQH